MHLYHNLMCIATASLETAKAALPGSTENEHFFSTSLVERLVVAVVTAILTLLVSFILYQVRESRKPRRQVSYYLKELRGLVASEAIAEHLTVSYKGQPADRLSHVTCDIENTGNTVVRNQFLRFEFPNGTTILDAYSEPVPPREYGFSDVTDTNHGPNERRYLVAHLEKAQRVALRFVVSADASSIPLVHPHNADGDVEVIPKNLERASDDRTRSEQFVFYYVLLITLPGVFSVLPSFLGSLPAALTRLAILLALVPLVRPFARFLVTQLSLVGRPAEPTISVAGGIKVQADRSAVNLALGRELVPRGTNHGLPDIAVELGDSVEVRETRAGV